MSVLALGGHLRASGAGQLGHGAADPLIVISLTSAAKRRYIKMTATETANANASAYKWRYVPQISP